MYIDIATANTATLGTNRILLNAGHADSATLASKASAFDHSVSVVLTGDVTGSASSTGSTSWSIATTASRMRHGAITVQTGSSKQTHITLQTFMAWMITTKGYIPSGVDCHKYIPVGWSYADNDILQFAADGKNYELQLAGCIIEFWGNATSYNAGVFRLRFHANPKDSFTAASGYNKVPVGSVIEYICNGSSYSPAWHLYADTNNVDWAAWTAGTTEGPKANIKIGANVYTSAAIPAASATASGIVTIGDQTWKGTKTIPGVTVTNQAGFNYSGIQAADANAARSIWFSRDGTVGTPVYNNNFKYNPATTTITIGSGTLSATNYSGKAATAETADKAIKLSAAQSIVLSGDTTGTASSDGSTSWAIATSTKYMTNLGRKTSMDIDTSAAAHRSKFFLMQADSNTTTHKPKADGYVLTTCWDTDAGYGGQIAFGHDKTHPWMQIRQNTQKSWGSWVDVITTDNFNGKIAWAAWTAGTTEGPKANLTVDGVTKTSAAIPAASATASGIVTIGAQTFHGAKTFDTDGFNYSGIQPGSDNADRVVWFAYNGQKGRPVYDNDFTYNPANNQLKAGIGTFNSSLSVINDASNTTYDALAYFRSRGTTDWVMKIDSNGKDYGLHIDCNGNNAFTIANGGRANMNTILPVTNDKYTLGDSSYYWHGAFIAGGGNIHWRNMTSVYTGDPAWAIGDAGRGLHRLLPIDHYGTFGSRLYGIPASCITIEKTTDGGSTWTDISANFSDGAKRNFFNYQLSTISVSDNGSVYDNYGITDPDANIAAGALTNHGVRVTVDLRTEQRYGYIDAFMLRFGCAGGSGSSTYNKITTIIETYDCYYDKVDGTVVTDAAHSHGAWDIVYKEENVAYATNDYTRCIYPKRQIYMDGANNRTSKNAAYVQKIRFTLLVPTWITAYRYYPRLLGAYAFGTHGQISIPTAATGRTFEFSRFMATTGRPYLIESWTTPTLGFDSDLVPRQRTAEQTAIKTTDIHYLGTSGRRWYAAYINQIHGLDVIADLRTSSTANTAAYSYLIAGNANSVSTTNAHSEGRLRLYSASTAYHELAGLSITTNRTHTLPDMSGWLVSTTDTSTRVGSTTQPVYVDTNGQVKACSYTISATINAGTTGNLAYYSGANTIDDMAAGTNGQVMQTQGAGKHTWQTVAWAAWTAGTATDGPKANLKIGSVTFTSASIPAASATASGVVTATSQTFAGVKTFNNGLTLPVGQYITQNQEATSNYTALVVWMKSGAGTESYKPQIGHHNTGNSYGAITLLPYATNTSPWDGSVGLYIGKSALKWENKNILHTGNVTWADWTAGSTAGPQANLTIGGTNIRSAAIPSATASASGIVTIGDQTFRGIKTFYNEGATTANVAAGIKFSNKDTTTGQIQGGYIYVYNTHASTNYNSNMVIQSTGAVLIGGGEAPSALYALNTSLSAENLYGVADSAIYLEAGGDTIANRRGLAIDTNGHVIPQKAEAANNNAQNLGASGNRWAKLYVGSADSYGGQYEPIYWNAGVPAKCSSPSLLVDLASTTAAGIFATASPRPGVTGILPVAHGGTGNDTGNAPSSSWVGLGQHTAAVTVNEFTPAVGKMSVAGNVSNTTMPKTNNANAEIIVKAHASSGSNHYEGRIGLSSNTGLYYMPINTSSWQTVAHFATGTANVGSATQPVYVTAAGVITAGTAIGAAAYHPDSFFIKAVASTDNAIVKFNGTGGQVQNTGVIIDDSNHVTAPLFVGDLDGTAYKAKHASAAHWSIAASSSGVIKVKINKKTNWMLAFTLRLYQSYSYTDYVISGYNYGTSKWYNPKAIILGSNNTSAMTITFGYDDDAVNNYRTLWVSVPCGNYTGIDVFDVTNGHTQIDLHDAFEIIHEDTSTGTVQTTVTASRPWYRGEDLVISHAASATMTADSTNPKITFSENGSQPVHIIYSNYDSYRAPAGLKVIGGSGATPAWFEVEGNIYAAAFKGNADSATKLHTAISINGTNFDGSANITTANWGTARTLTIGNKGQSVNGSANVTWNLQDILIRAGNEYNFTADGLGSIWFNYRTQSGTDATTAITEYHFGNGKKSTAGVTVHAANFSGLASNASRLSNTAKIGNTDHPVYFTANGVPAATTYRMAGTNATATTSLAITTNLDTGIWYVSGTNITGLYSQGDGAAYVQKYNDSWIHEIYGDYRTGRIAVRGKNNGTWQDWRQILDNKTTYAASSSAISVTWNTETTIATINGTAVKIKIPANPNTNTDTLVKQTVKTDNVNYKLLATTSASPSSGTAMEATYSANIFANPSTGAVSAVQHTWNVAGTNKAYTAYNSTDDSIDFIFA